MKKKEEAIFIKMVFSSVYCNKLNKRYLYSDDLLQFLELNPDLSTAVDKIFALRDEYMTAINYELRWDVGYYLMDNFRIEFAQSEGSELIFSLCLAIREHMSLPKEEVGIYLKKNLSYIG